MNQWILEFQNLLTGWHLDGEEHHQLNSAMPRFAAKDFAGEEKDGQIGMFVANDFWYIVDMCIEC